MKIQKKNIFFLGGRGGHRVGGGVQGECERRSEAFVRIQKKNIFFFWGGGVSGRGGVSGWGGGVRVDVNGEVKFL